MDANKLEKGKTYIINNFGVDLKAELMEFCAVKSPMTYDSWEYGDVYINEIKDVGAKLIDSTPEWKEAYSA